MNGQIMNSQTSTKQTKARRNKKTPESAENVCAMKEGLNGVNRLATKGEKILLTSDKTGKKISTSDKKEIEHYR